MAAAAVYDLVSNEAPPPTKTPKSGGSIVIELGPSGVETGIGVSAMLLRYLTIGISAIALHDLENGKLLSLDQIRAVT